MKWEEFYDKFYDWSERTQARRIYDLTTFGTHDQVADIVMDMPDEVSASHLTRRALDAGVRFMAEEVVEMQYSVDRKCMNRLVRTVIDDFTPEQVDDLLFSVDEETHSELQRRFGDSDGDGFTDSSDELWGSLEDVESGKDAEDAEGLPAFELKGWRAFLAFLGISSLFDDRRRKKPRFQVGDHVRVRWRGQEGNIIDMFDGQYMVSLNDGELVETYSESDLEEAW